MPADGINKSLTLMIHGESKTGKSTLAVTAPEPRLMHDVEGGHKFLPIKVKYWDPMREDPPEYDGSWDTCVVVTTSFDQMLRSYAWLQSGRHSFRSVIVDSISELQVKAIEAIAGREQLQLQTWGELLRTVTGLMRDLRDLTMHPTNPLQAVVLTAMTREQNGVRRPYLQGQSAVTAPYLYDLTGFLAIEEWPNVDATLPPVSYRRMHIKASSKFIAGERVAGLLGDVIEQDDLNITRMIERVYGAL
jgi:hypothetical protein